MKPLILGALCVLALAACGNPEAERQQREAAAAQERAKRETDAEGIAKLYDAAVTATEWEKARVHGAALLDQFADSEAARRIEPGFAEVKEKAEAARELRRMQGLWSYNQVSVGSKGVQRSAMIQGKERVDVDGSGPKVVQLVFRDHPEWKRHAYLVLQAGDFAKACYASCQVTVTVDDQAPRRMAAHRPDTDEAIAMFITDNRGLWRLARKAKVIRIEFPVKAGGTRTAVFETGGLDGSQMPAGWD
ncbi:MULTISPECIES: hypothetical protein [Stenotrophomonas]|uniref:Lipoprotein n=1 Tax=Stenotrophomonas nitritireducens TaxID=83617 RepID=A0ABR5NHG5_9GAMM|nr:MULTISPECIES: hypothetical protein [Stenotrophomonas]KQN95821.1 hypothetical protein ASF01_15740 [Stenotrophomonas sp. Leaf70]KRG55623.1 lipoprotein [Stenotrophomonas nitritireducens]